MAWRLSVDAGLTRPAIRAGLFLALFALPWIDRTNLSTLLFCGLGLVGAWLLWSGDRPLRWTYDKLFWLFGLYYLAYLLAWLAFPGDGSAWYALQQKVAFLAVPVLLTVLIREDPGCWSYARWGFVSGTLIALLSCLIAAALQWSRTGDESVFFYHDLVKLLSANAIYTSVYVLISIVYLIDYLNNKADAARREQVSVIVLVVFLFGGLLLLSSKLLIVSGAVVILFYIYSHSKSIVQRAGLMLALILVLGGVLITQNRINSRFSVVAWQQPDIGLKYNDYSAAQLDGLSLRVLLWRMGTELLTERGAWLTGLGGKHYHELLDDKIAAYRLYQGYQGIDLHSHYMESLVGFGVLGLGLWLLIIGYVFYYSIKQRNALPAVLIGICSAVFITESFLEAQAGILIFTVIISGEWIQRRYIST